MLLGHPLEQGEEPCLVVMVMVSHPLLQKEQPMALSLLTPLCYQQLALLRRQHQEHSPGLMLRLRRELLVEVVEVQWVLPGCVVLVPGMPLQVRGPPCSHRKRG
jgi:hypothetical protein